MTTIDREKLRAAIIEIEKVFVLKEQKPRDSLHFKLTLVCDAASRLLDAELPKTPSHHQELIVSVYTDKEMLARKLVAAEARAVEATTKLAQLDQYTRGLEDQLKGRLT